MKRHQRYPLDATVTQQDVKTIAAPVESKTKSVRKTAIQEMVVLTRIVSRRGKIVLIVLESANQNNSRLTFLLMYFLYFRL